MNGVVENPLKLQALIRHRERLESAMDLIALYQVKSLFDLRKAMEKSLEGIEAQIKEETK
jgi:hypothetical protein